MAFNKKLLLVGVAFLIPFFAHAQSQDYLYVYGTYTGSQYSIDSADQRVIVVPNNLVRTAGTYEARLYRDTQMIAHNFFEVPAPGTVEALGTDNRAGSGKQSVVQFAVALPLTSSVNAAQARIQLLKSGQVVVEKNLTSIPTQVLAAQTNSIVTTENLSVGSSYVFHLYSNNSGQLVADRDFQFPYDVVAGSFSQGSVGQSPYQAKVIDLKGNTSATVRFDIQSGKFNVHVPYVADAQSVVFYNNQNQTVLTIPVSDSSYCNDDGVCNADRGEDSLSCSKDCKQSLPAAPSASPVPVAPANSSGLVSGIIYTLIGLGLLGGLWWFFKRRGASNDTILPPSLPTPPGSSTPNNPV